MDNMPSIIVTLNKAVVRQLQLPQGDLSIGRRASHALVLEDAAVSADHASIFTVGQDSFLKDLDSTNGTYINKRRTRKHHLKPGDEITIGKYTLVYQDQDMVPATPQPAGFGDAALFVLTGFNDGKRIELTSTVTHLGMAGQSAAFLSRTGDRYTLMAGSDGTHVSHNGKPVTPGGHLLTSGDIIEVGETRLQFYQR